MQGSSKALPQPWRGWWGSEQLPLRGAWLLRMEAEGEEGWGLGTSATPLLSGEEEEEQLLTCLSAQLFVSRSPRETEAAGSRKSCPAGPARLLPWPYVLTPKQNRQPRRDWKGPPSPPSEGLLWGPCACLCRADTRVPSSPSPRAAPSLGVGEGQGPHREAASLPGTGSRGVGSVLAGGSVLPRGRILTGEQGSPWRQSRPGQHPRVSTGADSPRPLSALSPL